MLGKEEILITQLKILHLINDTFDDVDDFQRINYLLSIVHAAKLKDFAVKNNLSFNEVGALLKQHSINTMTLYRDAKFENDNEE